MIIYAGILKSVISNLVMCSNCMALTCIFSEAAKELIARSTMNKWILKIWCKAAIKISYVVVLHTGVDYMFTKIKVPSGMYEW